MNKIFWLLLPLALLAVSCDEQVNTNNINIQEYKKCKEAGMDAQQAVDSFTIFCVPKK